LAADRQPPTADRDRSGAARAWRSASERRPSERRRRRRRN